MESITSLVDAIEHGTTDFINSLLIADNLVGQFVMQDVAQLLTIACQLKVDLPSKINVIMINYKRDTRDSRTIITRTLTGLRGIRGIQPIHTGAIDQMINFIANSIGSDFIRSGIATLCQFEADRITAKMFLDRFGAHRVGSMPNLIKFISFLLAKSFHEGVIARIGSDVRGSLINYFADN